MKSKFTLFFILNIIASFIFLYLITWGILKMLGNYTNHGTYTEVPDVKGMKIEEVESFLKDRKLVYEISDSIFENSYPKGTVVDQNPSPKSKVKYNRKIYLTVNALAQKMVQLPELIDVSYSQAEATLKSYGLKVGKTRFEPSDCDQCIIRVEWNGKNMSSNSKLPLGAKVDLVIGQTGVGEWIHVPNLIGLTLNEVENTLSELMLSKYVVAVDSCNSKADSLVSIVSKQVPAAEDSKLKQGSTISIWLSCQ